MCGFQIQALQVIWFVMMKTCLAVKFVGDGRSVKVSKTGKIKVIFNNDHGIKSEVLLEDVKFIPDLNVNLFRISVAHKKGAKVKSERTRFILEKGDKKLYFDTRLRWDQAF